MAQEFSLDLAWGEVRRWPDDVLDLPERVATDKKLKLIVCVDEFQTVAEFGAPTAFQRQLRSHWQQHQNVCYCL